MRAADIDPTIRDWLYAREMLRRLDFSPDNLYFVIASDDDGTPMIVLELHAQGKTFRWTIGPTTVAVDDLQAAYEGACALWNAGTDAPAFEAEFLSSTPMQSKVGLIAALRAKGFVLPCLAEAPVRS